MPGESAQIIEALAARYRVLVLGGMAVIAHGLSRTTEDSDIWLDPMESVTIWCGELRAALRPFAGTNLVDVARHAPITAGELEETIGRTGMVRVSGTDRDLDIFHQPNQLELEDFETAWEFSELALGSARVMDESFLIATKLDTGRASDQDDVSFLEKKLRMDMSDRLASCDVNEAARMFSRYLDHAVCEVALTNPNPDVQAMGKTGLSELAEGGNPFAIAALKKLES